MGARLVFGVLGPLEVWLEGASVRVGGPRQRALLGLLYATLTGSSPATS